MSLTIRFTASDPFYRRAARVSMGTVFQIPWTYITFDTLGLAHNKADHGIWPEFGMEQLHSMGFRTASMALRNDTIDIHDPELKQIDRLAVILCIFVGSNILQFFSFLCV